MHKKSNSYLTNINNNDKNHSPYIISILFILNLIYFLENNQNDNKIRIFSSSIAHFNPNSSKVDLGKIDNIRAKLIANPSTGNIFDTTMKRDNSSKIIYKSANRNIGNKKNIENVSNDSIHTKNDIIMKRNNSNINIGEYMRNSIIKSKITSKNSNNTKYNKN